MSFQSSLTTCARNLWRPIYWKIKDKTVAQRYRGLRHLIFFNGKGIGDDLLLTAALFELRKRGGKGLGVMTNYPELFAHSPDVDFVFPMEGGHASSLQRVGIKADQLRYIDQTVPPDIDVPPPRHIIAEMCRRAGVEGSIRVRPHLYLTEAELEWAKVHRDAVVVQSSRRSASIAMGNKEWIPERFEELVEHLRGHRKVIQIGLPTDPPLPGATDFRGQTSSRQTAALLYHAAAFVGLVGFLMHLAKAVSCPSVIIFGGRERPDQSGYSCNANIYSDLSCSPCWRYNSCEFDHRCMKEITAQIVYDHLSDLLTQPRNSFDDIVAIPPALESHPDIH